MPIVPGRGRRAVPRALGSKSCWVWCVVVSSVVVSAAVVMTLLLLGGRVSPSTTTATAMSSRPPKRSVRPSSELLGVGAGYLLARRSAATAAAATLHPEFTSAPTCTGDVLQPRLANQEEVVSTLGTHIVGELKRQLVSHRKNWEFIFIVSALERLDMLRPGRRGLVFAAGDEPLISYFAGKGVAVVATDMFADQVGVQLWSGTGQHASSLTSLFKPELVDKERFDELVSFQHADMNHISAEFHGKFDFVWSTCSLEHVGSISLGHRFALDSMEVLKPGGVAVHTMEFTLSSVDETVERGDTALWRKQDMERLWADHLSLGYDMQKPCWNAGAHLLDLQPDVPPYSQDKHIKLMIGEHVCTSMGYVARKPEEVHT